MDENIAEVQNEAGQENEADKEKEKEEMVIIRLLLMFLYPAEGQRQLLELFLFSFYLVHSSFYSVVAPFGQRPTILTDMKVFESLLAYYLKGNYCIITISRN